jgi:hypothetical protein
MVRIIWTIIGVLVLIHGYLYIRYKTIDPCEAAIVKTASENPAAAARVTALLANRDLQTIGRCYLIAVVGASDEGTSSP